MTHDELSRSLADHLAGENRMVWCDMQLGPSGSPRPDVYTIFRSFMHPSPMAYECKISRSDFLSDVTSGKWQNYLRYACGVVFACEGDLIKKADVPTHCGLIVLRGSWRIAKKPVLNPVTVPQAALLKLVIDGVQREGPACRARRWQEELALAKVRTKFGDVVARTVRDRVGMEREIAGQKYTAQRIIDQANERAAYIQKQATSSIAPARAELCEALGLPLDAESYQIKNVVRKLKESLEEHPSVTEWRMLTVHVRSALERYGHKDAEERLEGEE